MTVVRSRKYLNGARGSTCKLRIPDVCIGGTETVVACHIRDSHQGRGVKASDLSVVDGCHACHSKFDGQAGDPLPLEEWLPYALRGLQETIEDRILRGLLFVTQDVKTGFHERPVKQRKPVDERTKIPPRDDPWPKTTRKISSRNTLRRERAEP